MKVKNNQLYFVCIALLCGMMHANYSFGGSLKEQVAPVTIPAGQGVASGAVSGALFAREYALERKKIAKLDYAQFLKKFKRFIAHGGQKITSSWPRSKIKAYFDRGVDEYNHGSQGMTIGLLSQFERSYAEKLLYTMVLKKEDIDANQKIARYMRGKLQIITHEQALESRLKQEAREEQVETYRVALERLMEAEWVIS